MNSTVTMDSYSLNEGAICYKDVPDHDFIAPFMVTKSLASEEQHQLYEHSNHANVKDKFEPLKDP